jgi:hypothetical protein
MHVPREGSPHSFILEGARLLPEGSSTIVPWASDESAYDHRMLIDS